jgi:DNA-binding Xre family transcriptional regulator
MTRLKKVLTDKKMSQKELAKLSDVAEYKISQLCMGKSKDLFLSTAKRICEVLNVNLDEVKTRISASRFVINLKRTKSISGSSPISI